MILLFMFFSDVYLYFQAPFKPKIQMLDDSEDISVMFQPGKPSKLIQEITSDDEGDERNLSTPLLIEDITPRETQATETSSRLIIEDVTTSVAETKSDIFVTEQEANVEVQTSTRTQSEASKIDTDESEELFSQLQKLSGSFGAKSAPLKMQGIEQEEEITHNLTKNEKVQGLAEAADNPVLQTTYDDELEGLD